MTIRRALLLTGLVLLLSTGALAGQAPTTEPGVPAVQGELLKWAVTQGGLTLVVVLLILNELRRSSALATALEKAATALATQAETARQQSEAFGRLAHNVEMCEAVRKMIREEQHE